MKKIFFAKQKKKGFSLLEMVIIVAIITIMTSVMLVTTLGERKTKEVEVIGREVTAAIRETQNYALTGRRQGTGLPCSFGFFINFDTSDVTTGGTQFEVRGAYRLIDGVCGSEVDESVYSNADTGKLFSQKDFTERNIEIFGFTSNQHKPSGGSHPSAFVAFGVPYGEYFDVERTVSVGDRSIGTEFVIRKVGDKDGEYHICVHETGLIEEIGFVKRDETNASDEVAIVCDF